MSESVIVAIIGVVGILLAAVVSYGLGRRAERQKQLLTVRAGLLNPISAWLKGAERMLGILGDTIATISQGLPLPVIYDLGQRKDAATFMSENTNEVLGILHSNSFSVGKTRRLAKDLNEAIRTIDQLVKYELLPRESEIVGRANARTLTEEYMLEALQLKLRIDGLLQSAYRIIAQIKTSLD